MINLKTELLNKKKEFDQQKSKAGNAGKTWILSKSKAPITKVLPWNKKNKGIEKRNEKDLEQIQEDNEKYSQAQAILKAKTKMYDKLTSGDFIPDESTSELFLVDFEQKSLLAWKDKRDKGETNLKPEVNVNKVSEIRKEVDSAKSEWVEYTDTLGRTRTCLKSELHLLEKIDQKLQSKSEDKRMSPPTEDSKTLMSDDMRREAAREEWERNARQEVESGPTHYEDLKQGEIRELGVGYFAFSRSEEERKKEMAHLKEMREETEKAKKQLAEKRSKEKASLESRLEKIRQRKIKQLTAQGKEIPQKLLQPVKIDNQEPMVETSVESAVEVQIPEQPATTVVPKIDNKAKASEREWDKEKAPVWTPAVPKSVPHSWQDPHDVRDEEFAPPSFYYDTPAPAKRRRDSEASNTMSTSGITSIDDKARIDRLMDSIDSPAVSQSLDVANEASDLPCQNDVENCTNDETTKEVLAPYVPSQPVKMSIRTKPKTNLLATKSSAIFDD